MQSVHIDAFEALKVLTLVSLMARLQVAQIDNYTMKAMKDSQDIALKKFPRADQYAQMQAQTMENWTVERQRLVDIFAEHPDVIAAQKYQEEYIKKKFGELQALSQYDIKQLSAWIGNALNLTPLVVENAFSVLDFLKNCRSKNIRCSLNFQPIFIQKGIVSWFPNSLAYTSAAEILFNSILSLDLLVNNQQISNITENAVCDWFRKNDFKVLDDENREYGKRNGKPISDFDALAYKDGHLYHLEIKLTHIRNDLLSKMSFSDSKLNKARKQLSAGRKYILENKEEIANRLGLNSKEEIDENKFHSYLVSNSVDFDKRRFGKYLKFSLLELYVAITGLDNLMCLDQEHFIKHLFSRFKYRLKAHFPSPIKQWFEEGIDFHEKDADQFHNFIKHHTPKLSEALNERSQHPLWSIEDNWYTLRDDLPIEPIDYFDLEFKDTTLTLPLI